MFVSDMERLRILGDSWMSVSLFVADDLQGSAEMVRTANDTVYNEPAKTTKLNATQPPSVKPRSIAEHH